MLMPDLSKLAPEAAPAAQPESPVDGFGVNLNPIFNAMGNVQATAATMLKVKLANAKAEQQEQKRQQDMLVMPTIMQDIQRNRERMEEMTKQVEAFNAKLTMPAPMRQPTTFDNADLVGIGLSTLFGGAQGMNQAMGHLSQLAQTRNEMDFQNQAGEFQLNRQNIMYMLETLNRQMSALQGRGDNLSELAYREQARQDARADRAYEFDETTRLKEEDDKLAVKREERYLETESRKERENKAESFNREIRDLLTQFGEIKPEVGNRLEARRNQLIKSGVPAELLQSVPTGSKTLRREDVEADNERAEEAAKEKRTQWKQRFQFMKDSHRDKMADLAARRAIMRERGDKEETDKATLQLLKEARGHKARVRAEIGRIEESIRAAKSNPDWGGFERDEKLAALTSELTGKQSELKEWNTIIGEYEQVAKSEGASENGVDWRAMSQKAIEAIRSGVDPTWVKQEYERLTGRKANF
jgi:hypothetical protein